MYPVAFGAAPISIVDVSRITPSNTGPSSSNTNSSPSSQPNYLSPSSIMSSSSDYGPDILSFEPISSPIPSNINPPTINHTASGPLSLGEGVMADDWRGKTVLITGVTGFVGRALLHKLLLRLPGISALHLIYTPTPHNPTPPTLSSLLPPYPKLPYHPHPTSIAFHAVSFSSSSSSSPAPLLPPATLSKLSRTVDIVFALTGQLGVTELVRGWEKLEGIVWLGSAFSETEGDGKVDSQGDPVIEERIYPLPNSRDPRLLLSSLNGLLSSNMTLPTSLVGNKLNTFSFYSSISESYLQTLCYPSSSNTQPLPPVGILRPSIISPAAREPHPGWVHGSPGLVTPVRGAGMGIVRGLEVREKREAMVVPVDWVVNGLCLIGFELLRRAKEAREYDRQKQQISRSRAKSSSRRVYTPNLPPPPTYNYPEIFNLTSSAAQPVMWEELIGLFDRYLKKEDFGKSRIREPKFKTVGKGGMSAMIGGVEQKLFSFSSSSSVANKFLQKNAPVFKDLQLVTALPPLHYNCHKLPLLLSHLTPAELDIWYLDFSTELRESWHTWTKDFVRNLGREERGERFSIVDLRVVRMVGSGLGAGGRKEEVEVLDERRREGKKLRKDGHKEKAKEPQRPLKSAERSQPPNNEEDKSLTGLPTLPSFGSAINGGNIPTLSALLASPSTSYKFHSTSSLPSRQDISYDDGIDLADDEDQSTYDYPASNKNKSDTTLDRGMSRQSSGFGLAFGGSASAKSWGMERGGSGSGSRIGSESLRKSTATGSSRSTPSLPTQNLEFIKTPLTAATSITTSNSATGSNSTGMERSASKFSFSGKSNYFSSREDGTEDDREGISHPPPPPPKNVTLSSLSMSGSSSLHLSQLRPPIPPNTMSLNEKRLSRQRTLPPELASQISISSTSNSSDSGLDNERTPGHPDSKGLIASRLENRSASHGSGSGETSGNDTANTSAPSNAEEPKLERRSSRLFNSLSRHASLRNLPNRTSSLPPPKDRGRSFSVRETREKKDENGLNLPPSSYNFHLPSRLTISRKTSISRPSTSTGTEARESLTTKRWNSLRNNKELISLPVDNRVMEMETYSSSGGSNSDDIKARDSQSRHKPRKSKSEINLGVQAEPIVNPNGYYEGGISTGPEDMKMVQKLLDQKRSDRRRSRVGLFSGGKEVRFAN